MASDAFTLAILLTLKDGASSGLDRFEARLRAAGKTGEGFATQYGKIREELSRDLAIGGVGIAGLAILKNGIQTAADYQSAMTSLRTTLAKTGSDGAVDLNTLAREMKAFEVIATDLGNRLPGTTQDFITGLQVAVQNGLSADAIKSGVGKALGELAVSTGQRPQEVAKDFSQFVQLYKIKPEESVKAADTLSRLDTSTGIKPAELIEASKYFVGRMGTALNIGGLKDAEEVTRLFGLLRKQGLEGSVAGTGLTNLFSGYIAARGKKNNPIEALKKNEGIDLELFDKKGTFVGWDEAFRKLEPIMKLSEEKRATYLKGIFGEEGMSVASAMSSTGQKGWRQLNDEQNKTVGLIQKNTLLAGDYNQQMEALSGTLTNLKVSVFETMLPGATAIVTTANELAGAVQAFSKLHPDVAKYSVIFLGIGSAALVAYSGIKTVTSGVQLLKLASAFRKGEGLLGLLDQTTAATERVTKTQAGFVRQGDTVSGTFVKQGNAAKTAARGVDGLTTSVVTADTKTVGLRKNLFSLGNVMKVTLLLETVGFTWDQINQLREISGKATTQNKEADNLGKQSYDLYKQNKSLRWFGIVDDKQIAELSKKNPAAAPTYQLLKPDPRREAESVTSLLQMRNNNIQKGLDPSRKNAVDIGTDFGKILMGKSLVWDAELAPNNPLLGKRKEREEFHASQPARSSKWGPVEYGAAGVLPVLTPLLAGTRISPQELADRDIRGANYLQKRAPALADPEVMRSFRMREMPKMNLTPEMSQDLNNMLKMAFPESFTQSMTGAFDQGSQAFVQAVQTMNQPIGDFCTTLGTINDPLKETTDLFLGIKQPLSDTGTGLAKIVSPAEHLPGSFTNIFNSATGIARALDGVALEIGSFQMPTVTGPVANYSPAPSGGPVRRQPGIPTMFNLGAGNATGAFLTQKGVAYVHANEEITPAQTVAFRDDLGQYLLSSLNVVNSLTGLQAKNLSFSNSFANNSTSPLQTILPAGLDRAVNTATLSLAGERAESRPGPSSIFVSMTSQSASGSNSASAYSPFRSIDSETSRAGIFLTGREPLVDSAQRYKNSILPLVEGPEPKSSFSFNTQLLERAEKASEIGSSQSSAAAAPIQVSINGGDITINAKGSVTPEVVKEIEALQARQLERIRQIVDQKLNPQEIEHIVRRRMENGRQRA